MHELLPNIKLPFDIASLFKAISNDDAVVYVGAGVSASAGLPTWTKFLQECIQKARSADSIPDRWKHTQKLLDEGDFLNCAEILQREIGQSLEQNIRDTFGNDDAPSQLHKAISRIPFSLAITSNYDRLLESAYECRPSVWTWRDPAAVYGTIKNNRFAVLKIHGDVGNGPSLVLTKTQYRDLMHLNKAFNECLLTLLSLKTFLFLGSSLRDHDLLRLIDSARLNYGSDFGPHYAVMFNDELDEAFIRHLRDSYSIHVIKCDYDEKLVDWKSESVCSFLKYISGKVANQPEGALSARALDSSTFNLRSWANEALKETLKTTGADRGAIAFIQDLFIQRLYLATDTSGMGVTEDQNNDLTDIESMRWKGDSFLVPPDSALGALFLQGSSSSFIYIPDIQNQPAESKTSSSVLPPHIPTHSDVKSALACQIQADGQTVGIYLIESFNRDAFTPDHLEALRSAALQAGTAYTEYRHRTVAANGIRPFLNDMQIFNNLMDMSRQLRPLQLSYLLYEIDYSSGVVVAHYDSKKVERKLKNEDENSPFGYRFDEHSLVISVLKSRQEVKIDSAEDEVNKKSSMISNKGVESFGIQSPLYATPLRVAGRISSILVCWSRSSDKKLINLTERVLRLAKLIANSPDRDHVIQISERVAYKFIDRVNIALKTIDGNKDWSLRSLRTDKQFRERIIKALLIVLTKQECGLGRIRFWEREEIDGELHFVCRRSYTTRRATRKGHSQIDAYKGIKTPVSNTFCQYTTRRSYENSYARHQHSSMFGILDENWERLHKDPEGSWIVAPIVHNKNKDLLGFISADNHFPQKKNGKYILSKEKRVSEQWSHFQLLAVDLVTDILSIIQVCEEKSRNKNSSV